MRKKVMASPLFIHRRERRVRRDYKKSNNQEGKVKEFYCIVFFVFGGVSLWFCKPPYFLCVLGVLCGE
jgi:hypothetical protein